MKLTLDEGKGEEEEHREWKAWWIVLKSKSTANETWVRRTCRQIVARLMGKKDG
jgi:hypothetical protein